MPWDELQAALDGLVTIAKQPRTPSLTGSGPSSLTPREREVLVLLAQGMTDREIATALFLSTRTVNVHVSNILSRLGVPSRRDAVRIVRELEAE